MSYSIWKEKDGTWAFYITCEDGSLAALEDGYPTKSQAHAACMDEMEELEKQNETDK